MSVPLFTMGFTMLLMGFMQSLTCDEFCIALLVFIFLIFLISKIINRRKEKRIRAVHLVLVAGIIYTIVFYFQLNVGFYPAMNIVEEYKGQKLKIEGQVVEVCKKSKSNQYRYIVLVDSMEDLSERKVELPAGDFKIQVSSKYGKAQVNDRVQIVSKVYSLFDRHKEMKSYYRSKGYFVGAYSYSSLRDDRYFAAPKESNSIFSRTLSAIRKSCSDIREYTGRTLRKYLPDEYGNILLGMLIGDKSEIPEESIEIFKRAGIVHLFSVSGFHASLWSNLLYKKSLLMGLKKRPACVVSILALFAFLAITGFSKSTIRASLMLLIFFLGRLVYRDSDSLNSLGLSAIIILLLNPFAAGDVGFLLSFFATLGIVSGTKPLMNPIRIYFRRIQNKGLRKHCIDTVNVLLVSVCACIFTAPFMILFMGNISLIAPITNLFIGTLSGSVVLSAGVGVILSFLPALRMFAYPVFLFTGLATKYIVWISKVFSEIPNMFLEADGSYLKVTLAAVLILISVALIMPQKNVEATKRLPPYYRVSDREAADVRPIDIYMNFNYRFRITFLLSLILILASVLTKMLL